MEGFQEFEGRERYVRYAPNINSKAGFVPWPRNLPMPERDDPVIVNDSGQYIAIGNEKEEFYEDYLTQSDFNSGVYHWIPWKEHPKNIELFPRLFDGDRDHLNYMDGPTDEHLRDIDREDDDLGEAT